MNVLPHTTISRLKKIPQTAAIWEGDRRSLGSMVSMLDSDVGTDGECIMWVDGSEGAVRAMEMVAADTGPETVVRTLLRAIESPHHPAQPARPQKIIIKDRQLQFFLRGALQGLEIKIEYASDLPLIDELFRGFQVVGSNRPPSLPPEYENLLEDIAERIWDIAPWDVLADSDILSVKIKNCEIDTIYVCVMGMMSAEYGILLYRSLESLKQFRFAALSEESPESLEQAFLAQDCWFLNYESDDDEDWQEKNVIEVTPLYGSLHPFEGMRAFLDEEEAKIVYLALEAIRKFCHSHRDRLAQETIDLITETYPVSLPQVVDKYDSIIVATVPELTKELIAMEDAISPLETGDSEKFSIPVKEDLIPDGSLVTLSEISWNLVEKLKRQRKTYYQSLNISPQGQALPAILIQTTRPKAQVVIETIKQSGGLKAICFNPGNDPLNGITYDLGMLQTGDSNIYIFAEYPHHLDEYTIALEDWLESTQQIQGYCSLVLAMGATGANRGNPKPSDMLAVFETKAIAGSELGMGVLELVPSYE